MADQLAAKGFRRAQDGQAADLAMLLTCAVTSPASRQSRQMARRLAREHPQAKVIITGCDVQADPLSYSRQGFTVVGRSRLSQIPDLAEGPGEWPTDENPGQPDSGPFCPGLRLPGALRTRGLLKVQDGCDANCAYCIVPLTRGRPRSLPLKDAAQSWISLGQAGAAEVVLTGVHLGRYGLDLTPKTDLVDLVESVLDAHPGPRLRLSSLEVNEISDRLLKLMAGSTRVCRHLHIPLQSGSDRLLKSMGRPYLATDFAQTVQKAAQSVDGVCLGADVLVGLPGEDEAAFGETHDLIESLPLSYLHVFPFSPRPGTAAAQMTGRPSGPEARRRAARLRELGEAKRLAFFKSQIGRRLEAVVESSDYGRTDNYCLVRIDTKEEKGSLIKLEITGLDASSDRPRLMGQEL